MSDDAIKRARRALVPALPRQTLLAGSLPDRGNDPLARARRLIEASPAPLHKPGSELAHVPMTCSATSRLALLIVERRGPQLRVLHHEIPQTSRQAGQYQPGLLSGEYEIEFPEGWACPFCGNAETWSCCCTDFSGALHCCGTAGGRHHCTCGRLETRFFEQVRKVEVRGASVAATPNKTRTQHGQPRLKQVSYERNR